MSPPLGEGRVVVVHDGGDVAEQERGGEGRGALDVEGEGLDPARLDLTQEIDGRGHVEVVGQALAVGLEDQGERGEARGHGEKSVGLLTLGPQRRTRARPPARQKKAPSRGLSEARGEQRGIGQLLANQTLQFARRGQEIGKRRQLLSVGQPQDDAVVAHHDLDFLQAVAPHPAHHGERQRLMDTPAEAREQAQARDRPSRRCIRSRTRV